MGRKYMAGILAAAAVILLFAGLLLKGENGEAEKAAASDTVAVTVLTVNSGTDKLTVDIQRPVVSGFSDAELEKDLNRKIEAQIDTARRAAEEAAEEFWRRAEEENYEPWPYIFYAGYKIKSAGAILSLKVTTLLYTGGPGMPQTIYYNVDTRKNELINLSDLFVNEDYVQIINSAVAGEMAKDIERYVPPGEFPGVSRRTKFFISDGKLYIAFAKYEVASGLSGEPEFLIPTEAIRGLIKDEYLGIIK